MSERRDDSEALSAGLGAFLSDDLAPAFWTPDLQVEDSRFWPHVPFAFWLVAATRPRSLVELGVGRGVSYAAFCQAASRIGLGGPFFGIEPWLGDDGTGLDGEEVYRHFRDFHDRRYASFSDLKRCAFAQAAPDFAKGSIDLLHIDGLRSYEAARENLELWKGKLSPRGIVLLHGTRLNGEEQGVGRLFRELGAGAPHFEFTHGDGLGLVCAGGEPPDVLAALCALPTDEGDVLRARFELLGARWDERAIAFSLVRQFDDDIQSFNPRDQINRFPIHLRFARSVLKTLDDPLRHFRKGKATAR